MRDLVRMFIQQLAGYRHVKETVQAEQAKLHVQKRKLHDAKHGVRVEPGDR